MNRRYFLNELKIFLLHLIADPHDEDDVECGGGVLEELRHDGLHADEGEDDGEERRGGEGDVGVELQHLQQVHDEHEDLVLGVPQQHRDRHRLKNSRQIFSVDLNIFC